MVRFLSLFSVAVLAANAQTDWKQVCKSALAEPLTPPALPAALDQCDSAALYYGFNKPADPAAALQCAWYQRAHPKPTVGDPFSGPGVLSMLYANGAGVARDYHLAIRFTCENTWAADAEKEGRIAHLEKQPAKFDLCDDATSGLMEGACEAIHQRFATAKRRPDVDAITAKWSAAVKEKFKVLEAAQDAFIAARTANEVDLSGTGRAAFSLAEEGLLRDQFLIDLRRFGKGSMRPASAADFRKADQDLNDAYSQIRQAPAAAWQGTVKPEGIRETEAAWLKLRDAWVDFARAAWPRLSADTVRTQITRLRVHQLQSLRPR
ncbi:MAG: lysozyme inhibitor LprI family protein [Terriglobia bacterium]